MQNNHNFQNRAFHDLFESISSNMPAITFFGILLTYGITAAINVYFLPIDPLYSIPAALAIQFGRFAVVFTDFLNPTGKRSPWPPVIATVATIVALIEYSFSVQDIQLESSWTDARYWSVYLFGSMLIVFGYILELNFISKGAEGYGMQRARVLPSPPAPQRIAQRARTVAQDVADSIAVSARPVIAGYKSNAVETSDQEDIVKHAIKSHRAALRAYRHKQINGIGNPVTVQAGIDRSVQKLRELGVQV